MIHSIRTRLIVRTAAAVAVLGGAATGSAATGGYQPFVTDFPTGTASTAFTPFVTDFAIAPRPPGGTVVIPATPPTSPARATGRDWADVGVGAGIGLGLAALAAAARLGVRRRRSSAHPVGALRAGTAD
jgi:hypothetical protein